MVGKIKKQEVHEAHKIGTSSIQKPIEEKLTTQKLLTNILYFSGSIGWPLALIIFGLFVVSIGYGVLKINRRYLCDLGRRR